MATVTSKSRRRPLRFWGWGYADEHLNAEETLLLRGLIGTMAVFMTAAIAGILV